MPSRTCSPFMVGQIICSMSGIRIPAASCSHIRPFMRVSRRPYRALTGAAFLLLVLCGQGEAAPHHIMSLKLCTDEVLMDLAAPGQIASISYLSREEAALKIWPL